MDVHVFKPPDLHQPSHMVSDILYWKNHYKLLANACFEHQRAIKKSLDNNDKYMTRARQLGTVGKEERRFNKELRLYQDILRHQMDKLRNDALEYLELETSLKKFSDDPALKLTKLDNAYKQARDKVNTQTKLTEDIKKDYHKSMFAMEKANIKAMLATGSDVVMETRAKLDELENKTVAQLNTYNNHLDTWQAKFDRLHDTAMAMETSYLRREEVRSSKVLSLLQKSVELTHSGIMAKRDLAFTRVRGRAIILEKVIKKDAIAVPVFEEYVKNEDPSEQYAKARTEVDPEENRQTTTNLTELSGQSGQSEYNDLESEDLNRRFAANKKLKHLRNTKLHLVTKPYEKQEINQLSLKIGDYVKQLLPENEDGLAFGEVVHGLLHKKKKGFYPGDYVTTVEKDLDSGKNDDNKTGMTTKPTKSMKNVADQSASNDDVMDDLTVDKRNKRKHRHTRMSKPVEIDDEIMNHTQLSVAQTESNDAIIRNKTQTEDGEEGVKKKHKLGMFSAIAQKFRPKRSKVNIQDLAIETEIPALPEENIECVQRFTEVQAFVPEPDSEDEENTNGLANPNPTIASFEEDSNVQGIASQPHKPGRSSSARRRRRESQH